MISTGMIEKNAIIEAEQVLVTAMKNSDVKRLDSLLHKDLLFTIPSGQTITKEIDLETYSSGSMKINTISSSEQDVHLIDDSAVVSTVIEMRGTYFDHALDGQYKIIRVWKLLEGDLKVIAGSSMRIEENNT